MFIYLFNYVFIIIQIFIYFSKLGTDVNGRRPPPVDILVFTVGCLIFNPVAIYLFIYHYIHLYSAHVISRPSCTCESKAAGQFRDKKS